ncbi:MAG: TerB family tellurite resistance protein [Bacteroidetes bacterium]|nr:TerB family tellurite resistance protein [Bacteroidota bacterium]
MTELNEKYPDFELLKFYSYLNIIKIDGIRKEAESQIFNDLIDNSLLEDSCKLKFIRRLNSNEIEEIDYSQFKNNQVQSMELLQNLILIAKCDHELHSTEKAFIISIGTQLGFKENDIDRLIIETKYPE